MAGLLAGGVAVWSFGGTAAKAADFTLTSPAFEDNGTLAVKNAGNDKQNPNCVGENVAPPLAWANPPEGTKSYALVMTDSEGRRGLGTVHMVAYGISASVSGFAEGELSQPSNKYAGGKNEVAYVGPCTPPGGWHHYTFTLIATDLEPGALQPGMTRDELFAALGNHANGAAGPGRPFPTPAIAIPIFDHCGRLMSTRVGDDEKRHADVNLNSG
jgi:Raf kinase inhibitor-like YbhB/YbcL family protein